MPDEAISNQAEMIRKMSKLNRENGRLLRRAQNTLLAMTEELCVFTRPSILKVEAISRKV